MPVATFEANAFLRIGSDNTVTVLSKHLEMGQGTYTGLATLLAPMRERREAAIADKRQLLRLLQQGTEQARALTDEVLAEVKGAMGLDYFAGLN